MEVYNALQFIKDNRKARFNRKVADFVWGAIKLTVGSVITLFVLYVIALAIL